MFPLCGFRCYSPKYGRIKVAVDMMSDLSFPKSNPQTTGWRCTALLYSLCGFCATFVRMSHVCVRFM